MNILVDAHMVGNRETGNETYVVNLLAALNEIVDSKLGAIIDPKLQLPSLWNETAFDKIPLQTTGNWQRLLTGIPRICNHWQADLLHITYIAPFTRQCPLVVSVHDVSFKIFPKYFSPRDRLLFKTLLPLSLKRATAIITLSQHAKNEILHYFPFLKGKVYAIPLAASNSFKKLSDQKRVENVLAKYGVSTPFIMAVGNLQPRKNLVHLIKAFAKVAEQEKNYQLVIIGKEQWQSSEVFKMVEALDLRSQVLFPGYVSDPDLVCFYNAAALFVYPSVYEGFGLPILEAMSCGTPVVTSNISSMPEVAGEAALLVNPHDINEISDAISRIISDSQFADELSSRGQKKAANFSWLNTASKTIDVYKSVLDKH